MWLNVAGFGALWTPVFKSVLEESVGMPRIEIIIASRTASAAADEAAASEEVFQTLSDDISKSETHTLNLREASKLFGPGA